ncbi:hypothetical protein NXS19_002336 [Fusarium pseudograminearum]|nr:hypothetical protein NXS19_002336 [Fusarium pseudograminearum]
MPVMINQQLINQMCESSAKCFIPRTEWSVSIISISPSQLRLLNTDNGLNTSTWRRLKLTRRKTVARPTSAEPECTCLRVYTHANANARNYTILIEFDSINHHLLGGVVSENGIHEGNYQRKYSMILHDPKNAMSSLIYHLPKLLHLSILMTQCHHSTGSLLI